MNKSYIYKLLYESNNVSHNTKLGYILTCLYLTQDFGVQLVIPEYSSCFFFSLNFFYFCLLHPLTTTILVPVSSTQTAISRDILFTGILRWKFFCTSWILYNILMLSLYLVENFSALALGLKYLPWKIKGLVFELFSSYVTSEKAILLNR